MSFTFTDGDNIVENVYSCTECIFCSTEKHFGSVDGELVCPLCRSVAEKSRTVERKDGMRDAEYQKILDWLQENRGGIGPTTVDNIRDEYPNGDDFLEACEQAYRNGKYEPLTEIDGIGKGYARNKLALGLAEYKDWSDGLAEPTESGFNFRKS